MIWNAMLSVGFSKFTSEGYSKFMKCVFHNCMFYKCLELDVSCIFKHFGIVFTNQASFSYYVFYLSEFNGTEHTYLMPAHSLFSVHFIPDVVYLNQEIKNKADGY